MAGLPIPVANYFPKVYRDNAANDPLFTPLTSKLDKLLTESRDEQIQFRRIRRIEQADRSIVEAYGYQVSADIQPGDSDRAARSKAYRGFQAANSRGTFAADIKPKIDAIVGGDSSLISSANEADAIILGSESTDPVNYWGTIGLDGINPNLGEDIIGAFDELVIAGNVYIDVDNDSLTSDQVAEVVAAIENSCAAYYVVYLCYIDSGTGEPVVYAGGIIG